MSFKRKIKNLNIVHKDIVIMSNEDLRKLKMFIVFGCQEIVMSHMPKSPAKSQKTMDMAHTLLEIDDMFEKFMESIVND
jgi:hypothetical protein